MSKIIGFEAVNNEHNIFRIGGKSLLPANIEWPVNPKGKRLTFILNIPTNILKDILGYNYPENKIISVFTTYDQEEYFLDTIGYHGDSEELENIKQGFTKVILHDVGAPRNDADYLIPAQKVLLGEDSDDLKEDIGSMLGEESSMLQNEILETGSYQLCMQLYGSDFSEGFQNIFYLGDSMGYLFLNKDGNSDDIGMFFTQCT